MSAVSDCGYGAKQFFGDLSRKRGIIQKKLTIMQICEETCRNIFPEELTQLIIDCWEDIIKEPGELLFCSVDDLIFWLEAYQAF